MNLKYILAAAAIALPAMLGAKPATKRVIPVVNPDGSVTEVRMHGDEFFSFMTDRDCTRILERNSDGFIVDAVRFGQKLAFNPEDVEILRAEVEDMRLANMPSDVRGMQRMASLDSEGRSSYPTVGEGNHSLVVLVSFADREFSMADPKDYFTRQLNQPGFSDYGGKGSAYDYYRDISGGKYLPQFDVVGPVQISKDTDFFVEGTGSNTDYIAHMEVLVSEAMNLVKDSGEVDFNNYDLDGDGVLDTVFFYYAGYGSADSRTRTIWPHQYDYRYFWSAPALNLDGKKMGPYACGSELKGWNPQTGHYPWMDGSEVWVDGIGTFTHEYGHVLGLPDLYDVNYGGDTVTPGDWDVMDSGCYNFEGCVPPLFSAYEQWVCHWLEFETAADATHYDLEALGNTQNPTAVRIRIPMNESGTTFTSEYFVIESRDNSGWDACFPNPGLLVTRVNYKKNTWTSNSVNTGGVSNLEIVYAVNNKKPLFTEGGIYPGAKVELQPSKKYKYWVHPYITSIAYDEASKTGSFDYNMQTPSDEATVLHDNPLSAEDGSRSFTLEWDPVEGVDEYLLTVKTVKSGKTINGFNDTSVGLNTSAFIENLSSMYWNLEMQAWVTCVVGGIPCATTSNVVVFTPSQLQREGDNAVGKIETPDAVIAGGNGCVIAPEGALIFNPAGQQLQNAGLAPGLYIVVYGGKSVKVMVR